jgi:hypothetical protein
MLFYQRFLFFLKSVKLKNKTLYAFGLLWSLKNDLIVVFFESSFC